MKCKNSFVLLLSVIIDSVEMLLTPATGIPFFPLGMLGVCFSSFLGRSKKTLNSRLCIAFSTSGHSTNLTESG
jgi:hypothetical protein